VNDKITRLAGTLRLPAKLKPQGLQTQRQGVKKTLTDQATSSTNPANRIWSMKH
jgi:hypothetical protein